MLNNDQQHLGIGLGSEGERVNIATFRGEAIGLAARDKVVYGMQMDPERGTPMLLPIYPNNEVKVVSLSFYPDWFPDRQELAASLVSRFAVDSDKRPTVQMLGHDVNEGEWSYQVVATRFVDNGPGLARKGEFEIEGIVVGGFHGKWHMGHRLVASYNHANYDDVTKGYGANWHYDNELAIYVPVNVRSMVVCPGHPDLAPLGHKPGEHELCTYCKGEVVISLKEAIAHSGYSNLNQERLPTI